MSLPKIFISAVTSEFGAARQRIADILREKHFEPVFQNEFAMVAGTLPRLLVTSIDECEGLIQIVGEAYGAEPPEPDPVFGRVSYTQFEFYYAEAKKKQIWLIFAATGYIGDKPPDQLDMSADLQSDGQNGYQSERREWQKQYRQKLCEKNYLRQYFSNNAELDKLLKKLEEDRRQKVLEDILENSARAACAVVKNEGEKATCYVPRALEDAFGRFLDLETRHSAMVIVGQSGVGKTSLVNRLVRACHDQQNAVAHIAGGQLTEANPFSLNEVIFKRLSKRLPLPKDLVDSGWAMVQRACEDGNIFLVIFIDAVNEYGFGSGAKPLLALLDELVWTIFEAGHSRIKIVITSRPETWTKGTEALNTEFTKHAGAYLPAPDGRSVHELPKFSSDESHKAYEKYCTFREITAPYSQLSELSKYLLRDPLLLDLATQVYAGQKQLPADLDAGKVFGGYFKIGVEGEDEQREVVRDLIKQMFVPEPPKAASDEVQRDEVDRDSRMELGDRDLYRRLSLEPGSVGWKLKDRNVLRVWTIQDATLRFRFNYDRFAEYYLALELRDRIKLRLSPLETLQDAVVAVVKSNLSGAERMVTILGALHHTLSGFAERPEFSAILRKVAAIDARGLSLAISVLARAARAGQAAGSAEILEAVLKDAEDEVTHADARSLPIIETVYRLLCDEEYRSWIQDQDSATRQRHLGCLYKYFRWGFKHARPEISGAAIQHLFFLWRFGEVPGNPAAQRLFEDAVAITDELTNEVQPLSVRFLFDREQKRRFPNVIGLMFMVLAELREEKPALMARKGVQKLVARLELRRSGLFRVFRAGDSLLIKLLIFLLLARYLANVLRKAPNPINFDSLRSYFHRRNRKENSVQYQKVMNFIMDPSTTAEKMKGHLQAIVARDNSWVLQMLTFALSTCYEKAPDDAGRQACLEMIRALFFTEPRSERAEYCASLCLYHINYFGRHATRASLTLMGEMAEQILETRKGKVLIAGQKENFNIVGTYGRALRRNGMLLRDRPGPVANLEALDFAIKAIESAKATNDADFYLYVCENLGLLGTLIEPSQVFGAFTVILEDVGLCPGELGANPVSFPFNNEIRDKVTDQVLKSFANIRILYRQEVDRYLLVGLEDTKLYLKVIATVPEFNLATFYSWTFEHLMFRLFNEYAAEFGLEVARVFGECGALRSARACLGHILTWVMRRASDFSP